MNINFGVLEQRSVFSTYVVGSLCMSKLFSDVTLVSLDGEIPAHKAVLAFASNYFKVRKHLSLRKIYVNKIGFLDVFMVAVYVCYEL